MRSDIYYFNPTIGQLSFDQVVDQIIKFISDDFDKKYQIVVGSDSEGRGEIDLVNAIIIHRFGCGARYFWRKVKKQNINSLRQKIYEEVNFSIETTIKLFELLGKYQKILSQCQTEIHVDIGENGRTREMIKEITGMVHSYGFLVKTKPYSFGASNVADRHV